tara:strand:+ start:52711 stop:53484 length:774 start_codon:yes stop_codon:yes gene_type:complete
MAANVNFTTQPNLKNKMVETLFLYYIWGIDKVLEMKKYFSIYVLLILLGLGSIGCQKDSLVTDVPHNVEPDPNWPPADSIPIVSKLYFKGKIDSTLFTLQDSIDGFYNLVFDSVYAPCDADGNGNGGFYSQLTGMYSLSGIHTLEVKLLKCIKDPTKIAEQKSLLHTGAFPYGNSTSLNKVDGVEVSWVDNTGKLWKSLPGSGSKNDDSFIITAISAAPTGVLGDDLIEGTMNITLYNATESIRIEGGEFKFQYGVY